MIKFCSNLDFDFGMEPVSILKDSRKELQKRGSCLDFLKFEKTAGQTDLHIIALGAFEGTGFNRNLDGFMEEDCRKNHHLFKKANRAIHRHHKNKPSDPKYGNIKAAAYNENMRRVELIVGLDNDKCADILDEQEKRGYTNWSMASKQAHDVCSWCGHKAKDDRSRCEHIPRDLGEINKLGEMCGMMNPDPHWFEMSYVRRPADRIGMSLKLAYDNNVRPMLTTDFLKIYDGFQAPADETLISKKAEEKRGILQKLAEIEKRVEAVAHGKASKASKDLYTASQLKTKEPSLSKDTIDELRKYEPGKLLKVLADNGIILSPKEFTKYLFGDRVSDDRADGMCSHLPSVFRDLLEDPEESGEVVNNEKFEPDSGDILPGGLKSLVSSLFGDKSLFSEPSHSRVIKITIMGGGTKPIKPSERTKEAFDRGLAKQYAAYKLAALNYMDEHQTINDDVLHNAVIQNWKE